MTVSCDRCCYVFRNKYDLNRHLQRKKPCNQFKNANVCDQKPEVKGPTPLNDSSGNVTVNNNYTLNVTIIRPLGNEDLSHIHPTMIIEKLRETNRNKNENNYNNYNMAGQMVIDFHGLVNQNEINRNIVLPNIRSPVVNVVTEQGIVVKQRTNDIVDRLVKTRAKQLTGFKESINETNPLVFQSQGISRSWKQMENFVQEKNKFISNDIRDLRTNFKIKLLNEKLN